MSTDKTVDRVLERRDRLRKEAAEKDKAHADVNRSEEVGGKQKSNEMKREVEEGAESGEAAEQGRNPPTE